MRSETGYSSPGGGGMNRRHFGGSANFNFFFRYTLPRYLNECMKLLAAQPFGLQLGPQILVRIHCAFVKTVVRLETGRSTQFEHIQAPTALM